MRLLTRREIEVLQYLIYEQQPCDGRPWTDANYDHPDTARFHDVVTAYMERKLLRDGRVTREMCSCGHMHNYATHAGRTALRWASAVLK